MNRIKSAFELPQSADGSGNGSRPPACVPPVEFVEFLPLARQKLPETAQNSTISTPYTQKAIYPEDSILADWMALARKHEESADAFIIGSILPVCGALLARRVWIQWGEKQKFANCWAILAGKPGDRKSSIIDLAEMVARIVIPGETFLPNSFSPETLFDQYSADEGGRPDKIWIVDDANAVLTDWRKGPNGERVAARFLELYDCKSISEHFRRNPDGKERRRRETGPTSTNVVFGATFNIACFQGQAVREGLARRFLYYIAESHGRLIVRPPRKDLLGLKALAEGFRELEKLRGVMDFGTRAALRWEQYQRDNRDEMNQTDSLQEAKLSRLSSAPMQTLSMAMIFEAARWAKNATSPLFATGGQWRGVIDERTLGLAIDHVSECLKAAEFLDSIANKAEIAQDAQLLLARVRRNFDVHRHDDFIFVTRTDLTSSYCKNSTRSGSWKPDDLYLRFIPHLERRGEACFLAQRDRKEWFAFRAE